VQSRAATKASPLNQPAMKILPEENEQYAPKKLMLGDSTLVV